MNPAFYSFDSGNSILSAWRLIPKLQNSDLLFAYNTQTDSSAFSYGFQYAKVNLTKFNKYNTFSANIGYLILNRNELMVRLGLRTNYTREFLGLSNANSTDPTDPVLQNDIHANHLHTDLGLALSYKKLQLGIGLKNSPLSTKWAKDLNSKKYSTRFYELLSTCTAYSFSNNDFFKINLSHFFISDFDRVFNSYQVSFEILQFLEMGAAFNNSYPLSRL